MPINLKKGEYHVPKNPCPEAQKRLAAVLASMNRQVREEVERARKEQASAFRRRHRTGLYN